MRVLLVDDHKILRDGLKSLLLAQGLNVVGEAGDGETALALVEQLQPQVVVMDIGLKGMTGIDATKQIRKRFPNVAVLALSTHSEKHFVTGMLAAGALGYVTKDSAFEDLANAVRSVAEGRVYTSQTITDVVMREYTGKQQRPQETPTLSAREEQVLAAIADGKSSREIGDALGLSVNTIDTHRRRISEKLGVKTVAALTKFAVRQGLSNINH
ncbi:MAG: response regulator transcription factor [Polyangiaceae bacterium]|nr:response regulator transcription factor [Polyangiaceae bacterium]